MWYTTYVKAILKLFCIGKSTGTSYIRIQTIKLYVRPEPCLALNQETMIIVSLFK